MKIFITGFMGSGKSTFGRRLAEGIGFRFIDLDEEVAVKAGRSIPEIFSSSGEKAFREMEAAALRSLGRTRNAVIATGGGTPCYGNNMEWINRNGISICLHLSPERLFERLRKSNGRPLLHGLKGKRLAAYIKTELLKREAWYRMAHYTIGYK